MNEREKKAVANAADEEQVISAGEREQQRRRQELADLQWVLSDRRGRRTLWRFMAKCGTFSSPWNVNAAVMGREAAIQDLGHWMRDECVEARTDSFLQMMQEHLEKKESPNA